MKKRLKNISVGVSAFFCVAAMVAWGFGMNGGGFGHAWEELWERPLSYQGSRGALVLTVGWNAHRRPFPQRPRVGIGKTFEQLDFQTSDRPINMRAEVIGGGVFSMLPPSPRPTFWILVLPYWLLILAFAVAPVMWWRNRYIARRDKKLFEEIQREKLGRVGVPADQVPPNAKDAVDGVPPNAEQARKETP